MKSINNINAQNQRVVIRVDYNVPFIGEKIVDSTRILKTKPTIDLLKSKNAKIILLSHLGRPNGIYNPELSLKFMVPFLEECFATKVHFYHNMLDNNAAEFTKSIPPKEIILFDNIRFYKEEEENDAEFSKKLAILGDVFINEAFSCSHRAHASIIGITQYLPSYPGLLLEDEVNNLEKLLDLKQKPITVIIGGKKVSTKFKILKHLDSIADNIVIGGAMANTFLKAQGYDIGNSYHEADFIDAAKQFLESAHAKLIIPTDAVIAKGIETKSQKVHIVKVANATPQDHCIYDLGPQSISNIHTVINSSKLVLWNGPLGLFEDARFKHSTDAVAQFIAKLTQAGKIQSIVGGGDTIAALENTGLIKDFTYVSTAGGAFLEWLEGEELPGIKALKTAGM